MPDDKHEQGAGKVPQSPAGEGPVLEWFYPTRGRALSFSVISLVIFAGFLTLKDWGFGWVTMWPLWLIYIPFPVLFFLTNKNVRMSAGADWLCYGSKSFIKTYDLVKVKMTVGGAARYLDMADSYGNALYVQVSDLQSNRELWDLVYNGILHSVHRNNAETNKLAQNYLGLNNPMRYR